MYIYNEFPSMFTEEGRKIVNKQITQIQSLVIIDLC